MKCPACSTFMKTVQAGEIHVELCSDGCGGMWFDQLELKNMDEPAEFEGSILEAMEQAPKVTVSHDGRRQCPKCDDTILMRFFYSPKREVEVDHCPECGGHWLDTGELRDVRRLFPSDAERHAYLDKLVNGHFGPELESMKVNREEIMNRQLVVRSVFGSVFYGYR